VPLIPGSTKQDGLTSWAGELFFAGSDDAVSLASQKITSSGLMDVASIGHLPYTAMLQFEWRSAFDAICGSRVLPLFGFQMARSCLFPKYPSITAASRLAENRFSFGLS
jgi:hypothetical protein